MAGTPYLVDSNILLRGVKPDHNAYPLVVSAIEAILRRGGEPEKPRRSLLGLWADLNLHITEEDIAEAHREMWGNFPRDIRL